MCYLELSSPFIWLFLFDRKRRVSWPDNAAHLQLQMHRYPWKHALVLTAASYLSPALLCVEHWSMWRPFALTRQATWFPHISSLSFPCGQQCQQHSAAWEGSETLELVGFGVEAWISSLSCPRPYPIPPVFTSNLRCVSVTTQSDLYSANTVTVVTGPSRDMTPALQPTKASRGLAPQTQSMTLWCHTQACAYV